VTGKDRFEDRDELLREFDAAVEGMELDDLRGLAGELPPRESGDARSHGPAAQQQPSRRRPRRGDVVVYRVRVDLDDSNPAIWRRLDLRSDLMLDVVHQVVQDAFGWADSHLHRFALGGGVWDRDSEIFLCPYDVANPQDEIDMAGTPEVDVRLDEAVSEPGDRLRYGYDYGDDWQLTLRLEKILPAAPGFPAAVCVDGQMAAPPEDSRFEYVHDGLGAVVDIPEAFDPAEVNSALARPWYTLKVRGFHPRLLELVNMLSWTDQGRDLGARLAALPPVPVPPAVDDLAAALHAHLWFLGQAADGGLPLTAAGYLRPVLVEQAARLVPRMGDWIGKANREDLTYPVADFRDRLTGQLGLLRKYKGTLRLTRAGTTALGKPAALFDHLATRLAPSVVRDRFAIDADLLVLAYATIGPGQDLPADRIAAHLTDLGYRTSDDRPVPEYYLHQYENNAHDVLVNVNPDPVQRGHHGRISPAAAALAHAALTRT
jgi:hypothetical protein